MFMSNYVRCYVRYKIAVCVVCANDKLLFKKFIPIHGGVIACRYT